MIRTITIFLTACLLFVKCTAPIEINTRDSEPVLVIYGCLTNENQNQNIRLSRSSPYFYNAENEIVSNAKVSVSASNGREYTFEHKAKGYYFSQRRFAVVPGMTYRLSVEVDINKDGVVELYEAETVTPPLVAFDSINITKMKIMGFLHYSLNIFMQEPFETENYYLFKYVVNDSISNDLISNFIIQDDLMINGEYIDGVSITFFNSESDFRDPENTRDMLRVTQGDRIRLQIMNIEKGYYYFIRDCTMEKYGENPFFGGPPSNIYTNLPKGAVGYFTSYCIHEKETFIPE